MKIADDLIRELELDNDIREGGIMRLLKPAKAYELYGMLHEGIGAMLADGCAFTADDINTIATGEQSEQAAYGRYQGYDKVDLALTGLLDPERSWCHE